MFELTDVGGHAGGSGAREGSRLFPRDLGRLPRDSRLSLTVHLPGIPLRGTHHKNRRGLPSDLKNEKGCSAFVGGDSMKPFTARVKTPSLRLKTDRNDTID
jgi:hypothetical protein